eukprot:GSChrysophyteH1.ASY1.ANO1.2856.1 assembled CDS
MSSFGTSGYFNTRLPSQNKAHGFTHDERAKKNMRGLFPGGNPFTLDQKVELAMEQLMQKPTDLDKYVYLHTIHDADETLFFAILAKHTYRTLPFVYTPTVGEACQKWGQIYRHTPRGLYLSINDAGSIESILDNHPHKNVKVIVVTDGERILGLGDLGVNGMGIPIGKLALYTACAGIHPEQTLPVHIDVGTNTESILKDPYYMGLRQKRDNSQAYDNLIQEFFDACQKKYGRDVLIQFEDFGNTNAFRLLHKHSQTATTFNDDIQGTASVVLAGIISSLGLAKKEKVADHKFVFLGAGEAGVGIADLIAIAVRHETGCSLEEARSKIWLVDSRGLFCSGNALMDAIKLLQPTAIIGVSAQGQTFTKEICEEMARINEHPLIFALSNPTSKAECTAKQAYEWTNGKCVFASGSPFDPVTLADGRTFNPGQGNNAYIFPGVGLGAVSVGAQFINDDDMYVAASSLAAQVSPEDLASGNAYPPLNDIRKVSLHIAAAVAENMVKTGRAARQPADGESYVENAAKFVYTPSYDF